MESAKFRENLEVVMHMLKMTQTELAEKSGVSQSALSMILNGERSPTLETVAKIANALPIRPETLLFATLSIRLEEK